MIIKAIVLLGLVGVVSVAAIADEPAFELSSIRQKGMGGAGVAIVRDESAIFVNPANISDAGFRLNLLRIRAGLNDDAITKIADLTSLGSSFGSGQDRDSQLEKINQLIPAKFGINLSGMGPSIGLFGFLVAGGVETQSNLQLVRPTSPTLKATVIADGEYGIGHDFQMGLMGQDVSVGGAVKQVIRFRTYNADTGGSEISLGTGELLDAINGSSGTPAQFNTAYGSGIGFDLGVRTKFSSIIGDLTGAVVLNNIATSITGTKTIDGVESPFQAVIPMTTTLGLGFTQDLFLLGSTTFAVDYKIRPDSTLFKSLYMGLEKELWILTFRSGLYQGYPSVGLGLNLFWILHADYAYYTQERGGEVGASPLSIHQLELGLHF